MKKYVISLIVNILLIVGMAIASALGHADAVVILVSNVLILLAWFKIHIIREANYTSAIFLNLKKLKSFYNIAPKKYSFSILYAMYEDKTVTDPVGFYKYTVRYIYMTSIIEYFKYWNFLRLKEKNEYIQQDMHNKQKFFESVEIDKLNKENRKDVEI